MQRVLLTGATGFVGRSCLARLRDRGFEVHAATSGPPPTERGVVWHRADLLAPGEARRLAAAAAPTHLLHLAWHTRPPDLYGSPANLRWVEASISLLRAAAEHGLERAAIAGSCAEYDWDRLPPSGEIAEEGAPLAPRTVYGRAKLELATRAREWAEAAGASIVWPRIFFLYGPGERRERLVPSVITALLAGDEARLTHGEQVRDYLYVDDCADALAGLVASELEGAVNVGSGRPVRLRDLAEEAARQLGCEELLRFGARPAPPGEPPRLVADVRRLAGALGWAPATDLPEGIARTIRWWRDAGAAT